MKYNPNIHNRKSIRLRNYDYSQNGLYFITICTQNRENLFGKIENSEMISNDAGIMIDKIWNELIIRFQNIKLYESIIMPNHIHGIIRLTGRGEPCVRPLYDPYVIDNKNNINRDNDNNDGNRVNNDNNNDNNDNQNQKMGEHKVRPYGSNGPNGSNGSNGMNGSNGTLDGSIGRIIQGFKSLTTNDYIKNVKNNNKWQPFDKKLWQRDYWDHIIRDEKAYNNISNYIKNNPAKWQMDKLNGGKGNIVMESTVVYGEEEWMV